MTTTEFKQRAGDVAVESPAETGEAPASSHGRRPIVKPVVGLGLSLAIVTAAAVAMLKHPGDSQVFFILLLGGVMLGSIALLWIHLLVKRQLETPLNSIRDWAADIRAGNLSAQLKSSEVGGFTELATDINRLGDEIRGLSRDSGQGVTRMTERLAHKTRMLEILYKVATSISMTRDLDELLSNILSMMADATHARAGVVYLLPVDGDPHLVDCFGFDRERLIRELPISVPEALHDNIDVLRPCLDSDIQHDDLEVIVVPLRYRDETLGVCKLCTDDAAIANHEDTRMLLANTGQHVGMAIEQDSLDQDAKRRSIAQERTTLAHELHDSLAQTLASLRFHVRVLDQILQPTGEYAAIRGIEQIETSLDEAHTELRELIAHFRTSADESGLVPTVDNLIKRFREETGITVFLQNEWLASELPASLELQVARIIQEALANIRKHSKAHTVRVYLRCDGSGDYRILVEDDGVGFEETAQSEQPGEHVGLSIMRERATRLGGDLRIDSEENEGTRIELTFHYPRADEGNRGVAE